MTYKLLALAAFCCQVTSAVDVIAHFMVTNTYSYNQTTWATDMKVAKSIGIDGFEMLNILAALNWAPPDCSTPPYDTDWQIQRIDDAFTAAAAQNFKLVYSFDMSYIDEYCAYGWNQTFMASMIMKYASSKTFLRWKGDILVTTYAGEGYGDSFLSGLKTLLDGKGTQIVLAPALTTYADQVQETNDTYITDVANTMLNDWQSIDGYLNWQAWPLNDKYNLTADVDTLFKAAFNSYSRPGPYIMAVSPWQFKDLDVGIDNSWVEYSDTLYGYRWNEAIDTVHPDIIELITWNDFPESHYIRDLPPLTGPGSTQLGDTGNYIYGHDHAAWRTMANYFIKWYKSGTKPTVSHDHIVFWHRVHPKDAVCTNGTTGVRNSQNPADAVFAWAVTAQDRTISMTVGSNTNWTFTTKANTPVMNMVPFPADLGDGVTPSISILGRKGKAVRTAMSGCEITADCTWADFNPCVAQLTG